MYIWCINREYISAKGIRDSIDFFFLHPFNGCGSIGSVGGRYIGMAVMATKKRVRMGDVEEMTCVGVVSYLFFVYL